MVLWCLQPNPPSLPHCPASVLIAGEEDREAAIELEALHAMRAGTPTEASGNTWMDSIGPLWHCADIIDWRLERRRHEQRTQRVMTRKREKLATVRPPGMTTSSQWHWGLLLLALAGCAQPEPPRLGDSAQQPAPPTRIAGSTAVDYWRDVQPIFERRCAVCHGCYDAPCQVNLTAYEGIVRDANRTPIYDISRLRTAEQTRLFEDAHSVAAWRKKQFFPVLQEQAHFWPHSDKIHEIYRRIDPLGAGLLDFNRLENR